MLALQTEANRGSSGEGGSVRPRPRPAKGNVGTRRNEVVNAYEHPEVAYHRGVAPGRLTPPGCRALQPRGAHGACWQNLSLSGRSMPCGLPGLLRCVEEATIALDASVTNRSRDTGPCEAASLVE
jgi:hypothetical protein